MNTFTLYGSEYPLDGQHAELMAQYLAPPSASDKWTLIRDWADSRQVSADDMLCLLQAIDTGAANIMLGGQFKTASDLDQIANKLGIDTTQEDTMDTNTEIIDSTWAGSHHRSVNRAAVACLIDYLKAGIRDSEEALILAENQGLEATIAEISEEMDFNSEQISLLESAWNDAIETLEEEVSP